MIDKVYEKVCSSGQLTAEIEAAGLAQIPHDSSEGRFYGVSTSAAQTTVHFADDRTPEEEASVDAIVAAHVPA